MKTLEFSHNEGWLNFHEIFETVCNLGNTSLSSGWKASSDFFCKSLGLELSATYYFANTFTVVS